MRHASGKEVAEAVVAGARVAALGRDGGQGMRIWSGELRVRGLGTWGARAKRMQGLAWSGGGGKYMFHCRRMTFSRYRR
jgi:hypothetical protein